MILLLILTFILNPLVANDHEWKKSLDKDEILIYTRKINASKFDEFRAETRMSGSINKFRQIITDIDNYHEWLPDCKSAEIVERPNPNEITYHMMIKAPFPISDRDVIQQLILSETRNRLIVEITSRPDRIEKVKNYVRMKIAYGRWTIQQATDEEIDIEFQYAADPGGNVPAWLVNSFVVKNPHKTLLNLRDMMAK